MDGTCQVPPAGRRRRRQPMPRARW